MAAAAGHAPSTIRRIWRAFGLQPRRVESFKPSKDPLFVETVRDIVGLCLAPPERALVLCVDEKSRTQALDRTRPLLPMRPGQAERRSHDLHPARDAVPIRGPRRGDGKGHRQVLPRRRGSEFRRFLREIESNVPDDLEVHLVMDSYATHELPAIRGCIDTVNDDPGPFRWTKSPDDILASIKRFCLATPKIADRQTQFAKTSESGH